MIGMYHPRLVVSRSLFNNGSVAKMGPSPRVLCSTLTYVGSEVYKYLFL